MFSMPYEVGKLILAKVACKQLSLESFFDKGGEPMRRHQKGQ